MARGWRNPQVSMLAFIDLEERVRPVDFPERLLDAELLMALYSVRNERAFCVNLDPNLFHR